MSRYAGEGAVLQEGNLKIHECRECGRDFVWRTSKRTGRVYRAAVHVGYKDQSFYTGQPHQCELPPELTAYRERCAQDAEDIKAKILASMTPAELDAWIDAEITRRLTEKESTNGRPSP